MGNALPAILRIQKVRLADTCELVSFLSIVHHPEIVTSNRIHERRREITEPFVCRLRKPEVNIINVLSYSMFCRVFVEIFS